MDFGFVEKVIEKYINGGVEKWSSFCTANCRSRIGGGGIVQDITWKKWVGKIGPGSKKSNLCDRFPSSHRRTHICSSVLLSSVRSLCFLNYTFTIGLQSIPLSLCLWLSLSWITLPQFVSIEVFALSLSQIILLL